MSFASLSASTFSTVVKARQAFVLAGRRLDEAQDSCECDGKSRRCTCSSAERIAAAERAYDEAGRERAEREAAWSELCAIRN